MTEVRNVGHERGGDRVTEVTMGGRTYLTMVLVLISDLILGTLGMKFNGLVDTDWQLRLGCL